MLVMRTLIFCFLTLTYAQAYDPARIEKDLKLIDDKFMPLPKKDKKKPKVSKRERHFPVENSEKFENLELKYFNDSINTRMAAPKRKRSR